MNVEQGERIKQADEVSHCRYRNPNTTVRPLARRADGSERAGKDFPAVPGLRMERKSIGLAWLARA